MFEFFKDCSGVAQSFMWNLQKNPLIITLLEQLRRK